MNYQRIYDELIDRARHRSIDKGEWRHIVPHSMGGSDDKSNLVHLTYREHYLAHVLLYKIHRNSQMAFALGRMSNSGVDRKCSSRTYAFAREAHSKAISEWSKEYMTNKTVLKNIETGEFGIHDVDSVDRSIWKGVNFGRKMAGIKGKTCFKDDEGNTYSLFVDDPKIKELGLKRCRKYY
ncbi:homing endonuclease [Acinetobacter phage KARL-1]|uniref:Homing endonuclease n=1 Tax=Acinetobacter phage KARL-1 TaxID=2301662 RepID=A0A385IIB6_9CAUD|nr:homing endonuclease [Acinetobacter phage KARL-1]AXY82634.1 homing endonuclease [Acinetobacter phage KARL-1]